MVYSKLGQSRPNAVVFLFVYTSGKDAPLSHRYKTTTDQSRHFIFSENIAKHSSFGLGCEVNGESFHENQLSREDLKHDDIHLR
ncbi:MAG: hypothetical protein V4580_15290 [Bacteroidota bacterium]